MQTEFLENMQNVLKNSDPNVSVTENGAIGYKTTGKAIVDLNFMLSSMRNMDENAIWKLFLKAYNENPALAIVWLFFARDVRGGCGERNTFRVIFARLVNENDQIASKLVKLIPEYGRWDDLVWIYDYCQLFYFRHLIAKVILNQLKCDLNALQTGETVSLCAKWLPSINTSSKESRRVANDLASAMFMTPREYRKTLARLRRRIGIVERKISANEWDSVNYEAVPSKAGMIYRDAFIRHDEDRYNQYLSFVRNGKANMNADAVFPYEIVHAYMSVGWSDRVGAYDETLELKWKNLPNTVTSDNGTLVIVDGSGSMSTTIGHTDITCHDVARSLGVYFSEHLTGAFKDSFITFSAEPKLIRFAGTKTLKSKLETLVDEDDCSNTNLEKTFDLLLTTALENDMKQEDMPSNLLIVSDMEFDDSTRSYDWKTGYTSTVSKHLFDVIRERWESFGYKLPRLVFWNVCSRTGTIPVTENDMGVALVSGFSPMIADMVMSGDLDPYMVLFNKLNTPRYADVWKVVSPF